MSDNGVPQVLQELHTCITTVIENQTPQVNKTSEALGSFERILINFLNDYKSGRKNDANEARELDEPQSAKSGMSSLKSSLDEKLSAEEILRKKLANISTQNLPSENKTLMQLITERGLSKFLKVLLSEGINPNYPTDLKATPENLPPILIAAKKGHSQILKEFKKHNYEIKASTSLIVVHEASPESTKCCSGKKNSCTEIQSIRLKSMDMNAINERQKTPCNFSVWSTKGETVLHLLFKESDLSASKSQELSTETLQHGKHPTQEDWIKFRDEKRKKRMEIREKYEKGLDVVLSTENLSRFHNEQMR
jgi:hypothetical protein